MNLELSLKQGLKLNPQMLQSMEILQMSTLELGAYLRELIQENPAAEMLEPVASDESEALWNQLQAVLDGDHQNRPYMAAERDELDTLARIGTDGGLGETLALHLTRQLEHSQASTLVIRGAQFLVACLDEDGYLREDMGELVEATGLPACILEEGLALIQSLDPAGVGARDLSQCLLLQLRRRGENGAALHIADRYLVHLGRKQYHAIARALNISQEEVRRAERLIQSLNPRPGSLFPPRETSACLIPDLVVRLEDEGISVEVFDRELPTLKLSSYYCALRQQTEDAEVRTYLDKKITQVRWAMEAIEQRRSTLLRCAQSILRRQETFFQGTGGMLHPLRLADVARELSLHESTVSRAIREKYVQCARGVYPLSFFLAREGGEGVSVHEAKGRLAQLVEREDKHRPLSDQQLCQQLTDAGFSLARRTVAKYRDELGIPSARGRRCEGERKPL